MQCLSSLAAVYPLTLSLYLTTTILPESASRCNIRCELISTVGAKPNPSTISAIRYDIDRGIDTLSRNFRAALNDVDDTFTRLQNLDSAWKLDPGRFPLPRLHPVMSGRSRERPRALTMASTATQKTLLTTFTRHHKREKRRGRPIYPAGRQRPAGADAEDPCSKAEARKCFLLLPSRLGGSHASVSFPPLLPHPHRLDSRAATLVGLGLVRGRNS
jgi:hypothetical protein